MASKRATIYLREETLAVIGPTDSGELSLRLAAICARYEDVVRAAMPEFSRSEWCAIMDANNGSLDLRVVEGVGIPSMTWANVHDSIGLGDKWEIDQADLVARMQQLPREQLLAIEEACIRFWQRTDLDTDLALKAAWCKVTE